MFLYRIARKADGYIQFVTAEDVYAAVHAMVALESEDAYLSVWNGSRQRWINVPESQFGDMYLYQGGTYHRITSEWNEEGN